MQKLRSWFQRFSGGKASSRAAAVAEMPAGSGSPLAWMIAGILRETLNNPKVGLDDDFFLLGGHSLLVTQVVARIQANHGIRLPLPAVFEHPTASRLAAAIEAGTFSEQEGAPPVRPIPRLSNRFPLSFSQQRLWFLDRLEPNGIVYNVPQGVRLQGFLDVAALRRSLCEVIRRHEPLRTTYDADDGEPMQVVGPPWSFALPVIALDDLGSDRAWSEAGLLAKEEATQPFDLERGPVLRGRLIRLAEGDHLLVLVIHHIAADGWSMGVLLREVERLYRAFSASREPDLPELPVQYVDYVAWERLRLSGELLESELAWWRRQLAGMPKALDLPADHPRPPRQTFRGGYETLVLPLELGRELTGLAARQGATLFMSLLAGFQALLARSTGQTDLIVGSPTANRERIEAEALIGFFVNTLVLRADLGGDPSFTELLHRARDITLGAYAHQSLPFEKLVAELQPERDPSRPPLIQVLLVLQNAPVGPLELPGLLLRPVEVPTGAVAFDLVLSLTETPAGLEMIAEYARDLFDATTVRRMLSHWRRLLENIAADPGRRLSELGMLDAGERQQILVEWPASPGAPATDTAVHELFLAQVERTPDAPAVLYRGVDEESVSYRELACRTDRLVCHLRRLGVGPGSIVGICAARSSGMIVSLLAVLKVGGAYLPLDPAYPTDRLALMLEDAGADLLVTEKRLLPALSALPKTLRRFCLEALPDLTVDEGEEGASLAGAAMPDDPAYVIYTSGSTGRPKGVVAVHRGLASLAQAMADVIGLAPGDRFFQFASLAFDASAGQIYPTLIRGATLVLHPDPARLSTAELLSFCAEQGVTVLDLPAALWREAVRELATGALRLIAPVRAFLTGGEALSREVLLQWTRAANRFARPVRLVSFYGPTEATVTAAFFELRGEVDGLGSPMGRPLPGVELLLLDAWLRPVPAGAPGEIYLGGAGLTCGYPGRPEATAASFLPHPFSDTPGARLYRTGDLARRRGDGELEFLGRVDQQVKIRGFRVEPGEVEAVLAGHPAVREAVVVVQEVSVGDQRLVGYVVLEASERAPGNSDLRAWLAGRLPQHMIPVAFVTLDSFPLTSGGKIDRRALPAPKGQKAPQAIAAPLTPFEEQVAGMWTDLLGVERVAAGDNFFDLGGHSLLATRLTSRIREAFGVELPLRDLFEKPTLGELARFIEQQITLGAAAPPLLPHLPHSAPGAFPLSFSQQRLWFLDQLDPGSPVYNIPAALRLGGRLDSQALAKSLTEVVRRHSVLRTVFAEVDGGPVQIVNAPEPVLLPTIDLEALPPFVRDVEVRRLAREFARLPFDLARDKMLRAALVRFEIEEHAAFFTLHHIASDGWSMGVLVEEISALYDAYLEGRPSPLPEPPIQYFDYALWQRGWLTEEVLEQELAYWREALTGIPVLQLPTDRPRPPFQTFRGAVRHFAVPEATAAALKVLAQRQGGTLFMVLLAGFAALLHRYSGQNDIAIGLPTANRMRSQLEGLIGFFVNTLVLRTDLAGGPSFEGLLAQVRHSSLDALAHQELPFEKVVFELQPERNLSVSPLFQVMFALQNAPAGSLSLSGLVLEPFPIEIGTAKFDLTLDVSERAGYLAGSLEYNTDLFDRTTIDRVLGHFGCLLEAVAAEPETSIADLSLLSAGERDQLLVEWNATDRPVPAGCVHEWIAAQAARTPEAVAVTFGAESLTYRELDRRANGIAWRLREWGVGPEVLVGVALERSLEMVVGVLGVLKAGGAYVPLEPSYPAERLAFMMEDSGVATVLKPPLSFEEAADAPPGGVGPDNAAYVLYTSGSTGRPKGVQVPHGALANLLAAMAERIGFSSQDVLVAVTSLSFDIAGLELYLPLIAGGQIVLASREEAADGRCLQKLLAKATLLQATPATWRLLIDSGWQGGESLKALSGGEALSPSLASSLLERVASLWNVYGPTETTVYSTAEVVRHGGAVSIGRPIANTEAYVLDGRGAPAPLGVPGELVLGGAGVARGYLGRPELTAEKFVPNPFGAPGSRMYRTGDLVRHRADGTLDFLGRIDHQAKIRGFRVELGEIEAVLARHPAVRESVVVALADGLESRRLVAYLAVKASAEGTPTPADLRVFIKKALPDYMVPSSFVFLSALPLTPSGKVDRRSLPSPNGRCLDSSVEFAAPTTPVEEVLAEIWRGVLDVTRVGRHDNFFDLGGHSLLLVELRRRLQERFGREFSMVEMFQYATVAEMAKHLETEEAAEIPRPLEIPDRGEALRQGRERLKRRAERQAENRRAMDSRSSR